MQPAGGRRWWAHPALTRINIDRINLRNQIEDVLETEWSMQTGLTHVRTVVRFRLTAIGGCGYYRRHSHLWA